MAKVTQLKSCTNCGNLMAPKHGMYEYSRRKYCSNSCATTHRNPTPYFNCGQCKEEFPRRKSLKKNGSSYDYNQKFCSRKCAYAAQRNEYHFDKNGYKILHVVGRGDVPEHRFVMEGIIGRKLFPDETVHHKNGVRADNRPENLELWSSRHCKGQRVEDKIIHAREILNLYGVNAGVPTISEAITGLLSFAA